LKAIPLTVSLSRARTAFRMGDYSLAERLLKRVLTEKPDFAPAYNFLGGVCEKLARYDEAIRLYKKAIRLKPDYVEAYNNLGIALKNLGRPEASVTAFKKALNLSPRRADIHYNLGNVYKLLKNHDLAIQEFLHSRELDPGFVATYNNLGTIYEQLGRFEEAAAIYSQGLEVDFNQPKLHYNLGIVLEKTGKLKEAQKEFEQALKVKHGWVEALNNLGVVLQKQGKNKEAVRVFQEMLKIDPQNLQARNNLGVVSEKLGRSDEALRHYREALQIDPRYSQAVSNLGALFEREGQYSEALEEFERLHEIDPEVAETRLRLGTAYMLLERFDEADRHFRALRSHQDPRYRKASLRALGSVYQRTGKTGDAERCFEELVELEPENELVHLDLALLARDNGDLKRAEKEVKLCLEKAPGNEAARLLQGELYFRQGRLKHSAQVFEDILEGNPACRPAHDFLAKIFRQSGESEKAIANLERVMALEGSSADPADIDKLRDTLQDYEAAVAEYEPRYRDEWESNRSRLRTLGLPAGFDTADQNGGESDIDSLMIDELPKIEEDEVPIINIGGAEPVLKIEEEEEELDLAEVEEEEVPPDEKAVELEDRRPPSLLNLLKDQDLYEENPDWRGYQPPAFQSGGAPAPPPGEAAPAEPPSPQQLAQGAHAEAEPERPSGEEVLAESLKDSVQAQREMIADLARELKDASRQLQARSQFMPVPVPMPRPMPAPAAAPPPPLVPEQPPVEAEGLPRFAGEEEDLEAPLPSQEEEEVFDTEGVEEPTEEEAAQKEIPEEPAVRLEEEDEELWPEEEALPEEAPPEEETLPEEAPPEEEAPAEEAVPEVTAPEVTAPEVTAPEVTAPEEAAPAVEPRAEVPAEPAKSSAALLDYLSGLTEYLPEPVKADYLSSEQHLKMEYLRSRLAGKPGVKREIEQKFPPRAPAAADVVTAQNIAATFSFIKTLASFHPDGNLGAILRQKIDGVLQKIER
jgi:tetratricopeptide (TPR) repeat protein